MIWLLGAVYGLLALVALSNLVLMQRPGRLSDGPRLVVLIPSRNEAANLRELLPQLTPQASVIVYDDESDDGTGAVAEGLGATVLRGSPLPAGWTGKNRACHELGQAAAETDAEWFVFIDADVRVQPDFASAVRSLCAVTPPLAPGRMCPVEEEGKGWRWRFRPPSKPTGRPTVITGFPRIVPGRGAEPLFLAWVGWILLSANPFGVINRTGMGHSRFSNGQFHVWPRDVYLRLRPNEAVKGSVLEDVMIGRLLARERIPVQVANISKVFSVRMYDTWRETLDGMSKNSYEITGSVMGSYALAALLLVLGWGWLAAPWTYAGLALSGAASAVIVRSRIAGILVAAMAMPVILTIGAFTIVRSVSWRRQGRVVWKGRVY